MSILSVVGWAIASDALAQTPDAAGGIGVTEHLGARLPPELVFRDHRGDSVRLGDYFDGRMPAVVIFGYHTCPMLCSLVQDATADALREIGWVVGRQFDVVVISIDPADTPELASRKRAQVIARYQKGRGQSDGPHSPAPSGIGDDGWHYLTGDERAIRAAADTAGFGFRYDPTQKQFAHSAVIVLATPEGAVARYLYGLDVRPTDVRYGLMEAAAGRSVGTIDRVLLYCMHYDPGTGRYAILVGRVMQLGAVASAACVGGLLLGMVAFERRRRARERLATS